LRSQLPYEVVEVNPLTKSELKWSTYKKVWGLARELGGTAAGCSGLTHTGRVFPGEG